MFEAYPLTFDPLLVRKIWGGDRLATVLGRDLQGAADIGESWEISDRPGAQSVVNAGVYAGRTLGQLMVEFGTEIYGGACRQFPLLVKLIDARERLSLQVHPDERTAAKLGGEPKTEAWYILQAGARSEVVYGFRRDVSKDEFLSALAQNDLNRLLQYLPAHKDDFFFLEAGTIHATGAGILFVEIQQNSDTTYRVHDWGRKLDDGHTRELHLAQALESMHYKRQTVSPQSVAGAAAAMRTLAHCHAFMIEHCRINQPDNRASDEKGFQVWIGLAGEADLHWPGYENRMRLAKGSVVLIPAAMEHYMLNPKEFEFLRVSAGYGAGSAS